MEHPHLCSACLDEQLEHLIEQVVRSGLIDNFLGAAQNSKNLRSSFNCFELNAIRWGGLI
jgi:hypothetical protein